MKIVYITQHFPPEIGAAQGRAYDMSSNLSKLGHDLHVLTTFPNQYSTRKLYTKEKIKDLKVYRSFRIKDTKTSSLRRLANYLSFMISSIFSGLLVRKPDIIYATSPQLFQGVTGYVLSRLHRAKFVFEIRDLWVDFAELLGQFNNKKLLNLARRLEKFLYNKADLIVVVTKGYKTRLIEQGVPENKIIVIPNGVDPSSIKPFKKDHKIKKEYGIEDKFLVLYTGNIGAAQGLHSILSAAEQLKNDPTVFFMFIGEGVEKAALKQQASASQLNNVLFLDSKKKDELTAFYNAADIGIVSLKRHPLFEITIPSKVFDYMAVSLPVLIGVDGEAREIVENHQAGFFFEPENPADFIRALKYAQSKQENLQKIRNNLQHKLLMSYNRETLAKELSDAFNNLTSASNDKLHKKTTSS